MKVSKQKNIGGLKCLCIEENPKGPCIVLFHGYGADASDLMPLSEMMKIPNANWIFPDAPMEVSIAPGFHGRAWFNIDQSRLEKAMVQGEPMDMSQTTPSGFEGAAKLAKSFFAELSQTYKNIFVGGFSQGAMLATELALSSTTVKPKGLIILSGTWICGKRWIDMAQKNNSIPFFQSHGKNDALLGYSYAENLNEALNAAGMFGEFMSFSGGHEIPPQIIKGVERFIVSQR
jgi:phospholipase/carboxylesterase